MGKKKQDLTQEELLEQALVPESERPYKVPGNWVWTRLGEVCIINPPKPKFDKPPEKVSFIPMAAVSEEGQIFDAQEKDWNEVSKGYTCFQENDVIFAKITPCMENGKSAVAVNLINKIGFGSTEFYVLRTLDVLNNKLLYHLVRAKWFREEAKNHMAGAVGQQRVRKEFLENYKFPLPPLAEQQRLVDQIESLFEKLDQAKGLIQDTIDSFENRKAAILHKAFSGELTKKWRKENGVDDANSIMEQVVEQRKSMNAVSKELSQCLDDIDLEGCSNNNGWICIKAMLFCDNITCGGTPTGYITNEGDVPFLKVYNIVNNAVDFDYKPQFIDTVTHNTKLKSSVIKPKDVIMNIVGPPLRKIALIPNTYDEWNMNQAIVRFRTVDYVEPKYLYYALLNPETLDEIIQDTKGVVGQANISITQCRNLIIPIASKQEQIEIVRILDDTFGKEVEADELCRQIENIDLMKKSILARVFRGEIGTNDPSEESALELLKEIISKE